MMEGSSDGANARIVTRTVPPPVIMSIGIGNAAFFPCFGPAIALQTRKDPQQGLWEDRSGTGGEGDRLGTRAEEEWRQMTLKMTVTFFFGGLKKGETSFDVNRPSQLHVWMGSADVRDFKSIDRWDIDRSQPLRPEYIF